MATTPIATLIQLNDAPRVRITRGKYVLGYFAPSDVAGVRKVLGEDFASLQFA